MHADALTALAAQCEALLRLGREQVNALASGDLDGYEELLAKRQTLLEELGAGNDAGESRLAAALAGAPATARGALLRTLEELAEIDDRNAAALTAQLRGIREALPAIDAGRRAAAAYHGYDTAGPRSAYVDAAS